MPEDLQSPPDAHPDPPVEPMPDSDKWFESGPEAILDAVKTARLIARLGLVQNALVAQMDVMTLVKASRFPQARRMRSSLSGLVTTAALTAEATQLVQANMREIRRLAIVAGATEERLTEIGQLCAGKHPASALLLRARNKVGFHWDRDQIHEAVMAFSKNKKLVWMEASGDHVPVHRLASDVLAHILFPESDNPDTESGRKAVGHAMDQLSEAIGIIGHAVTAATYGFMRECNARRRERLVGINPNQGGQGGV
jgi:hypothetical protein